MPHTELSEEESIKKVQLIEYQRMEQERLKVQALAFQEAVEVPGFADELEARLFKDISKKPELLNSLMPYQFHDVLALNMQEIVVGPIVQLAQVEAIEAAYLFAIRLSRLKMQASKNRNYMKVFNEQISCLSLPLSYVEDSLTPLQNSLAHLGTIFTYKFPLVDRGPDGVSIHPNRNSSDLIDPKKQKALRMALAEYVANISAVIAGSIWKYSKEKKIFLRPLIIAYILREKETTPKKTWERERALRYQVISDAEMASRELIHGLNVIEMTIYTISRGYTYEEKDTKIAQLLKWVNEGISMISYNSCSFYYMDSFRLGELRELNHDHTQFASSLVLKEAFERYIRLRDSALLLSKLRSRDIFLEWGVLTDLPSTARKYLNDNYTQFKGNIFEKWTLAMFANLEKLVFIHREWLKREKISLHLSLFFGRYSQDELQKILNYPLNQLWPCLKLLVQSHDKIKSTINLEAVLRNYNANYHYNYEFSKILLETTANEELVTFIFQLPRAYFALVAKENGFSSALNNYLFYLPQATKEVLFKHNPSADLLNVIQFAATHPEKNLRKRYQLLMKLPELVVHPELLKQREFKFILHHDWNDLWAMFILLKDESPSTQFIKFSLLSNLNGITCHKRAYCLREQQLTLDVRILPLIQHLLIKLKRPLPQSTLQALCSPWFIEAYANGCLKVENLCYCTPEEIEGITAQTLKKYQSIESDFTHVSSKKSMSFGRARHGLFKPSETLSTVNPYAELSPVSKPKTSSDIQQLLMGYDGLGIQ